MPSSRLRGTLAAIVKKLNEAVIEAMNTRAVKDRMQELGVALIAPERRSPDYLQKFVEAEIEKWAGPIKASGVSMN
jgi:tripartite-type tricarboxylate transporter receptor subunit TctC